MKNAKGISYDDNNRYHAEYEGDRSRRAMTLALSKTVISDIAFDPIIAGRLLPSFSCEIATMPVTNQKASGRCWIFAGLNILRETVAKKLNVESFELSQNYLAFYDKLEKANYMLESIINTVDRDIDDRTVSWILSTGIQDGGQWDMFVNLVEKYGVMPKYAMQETFQSSNTSVMNRLANRRLREFSSILRESIKEGAGSEAVQRQKDEMMSEFYGYLVTCFGAPPKRFDLEYTDKDQAYHHVGSIDPVSFYNDYIGCDLNLEDYISIINAPTDDKPLNCSYTVKFLGNVVGGRDTLYGNLEMDELVKYTAKQLESGEAVWFGSDVGKGGERKLGIWDTDSFDYGAVFAIDYGMDKKMQLDYRDSCMNHAMVITGVNITEQGMPNRWKIQNSWGDEHGEKGYFIGGQGWFEQFVYQVVINKKYLPQHVLDAAESARIALNPWDPMGALATE